jgi:hypothetical protein
MWVSAIINATVLFTSDAMLDGMGAAQIASVSVADFGFRMQYIFSEKNIK